MWGTQLHNLLGPEIFPEAKNQSSKASDNTTTKCISQGRLFCFSKQMKGNIATLGLHSDSGLLATSQIFIVNLFPSLICLWGNQMSKH
jgi:hypothetical protein